MSAASVASPPRRGLLITPYTLPRDVLVWNRLEKSWLRIDLGNQLVPRVEWLRGVIARQLGVEGRVAHVFVGRSNRPLATADFKRSVNYFTFDGYLSFACSSGKGESMAIYVKTLSGRTVMVDVRSSDLVADVKLQLEAKEGIPTELQRLSFADAQLDDERTLDSYNIKQESTLHVALKMRGGSAAEPCTFVDMANEAGLERLQWDSSAPDWCLAGRGLNLEGLCTNSDCEALGQMVVMPMGFRVFDIQTDSNAQTTRCPCCAKFVQPLTCGFTDCEWKWTGLKASVGGDPAQRTERLDWATVGDEYVRFDEADAEDGGSGMVSWLRLKIQTRSNASLSQSKARTCNVCLLSGADSQKGWISATCSHCFHAKCLDGWKAAQQQQGRAAECPMCRLALC